MRRLFSVTLILLTLLCASLPSQAVEIQVTGTWDYTWGWTGTTRR